MLIFLAAAATIWFIGRRMQVPRAARWQMIALLYIGVLIALVVLPEASPLRAAFGEPLAVWAALGVVAALVWAYRIGLGKLRARARGATAETPEPTVKMGEIERERYARHIMLREIGGPGQQALRKARVLVIGAGGLGAPVLLYLGGAGVGTIGVIDDDVVDNTNLQRQVIHTDARIGMPKVFSAEAAIRALNPFVAVRPYNRRLTEEIAETLFAEYDLILDGSDNFTTRRLANRVAARLGKPLIAAAITQWEGQITVYDPAEGAPCFHCIFPEDPAPGLVPTCAEAGVIGPLPGVLGSMMAVEAIKLIAGAGAPLRGAMLIYDALWGETRRIKLKRNPDCPVCGAGGLPAEAGAP